MPARTSRRRARAAATLATLLLALTPMTAAHATKRHPGGCARPSARLARALASLHYPWRSLGYRIVAVPPRHDGLLALTMTEPVRRTEVYVDTCANESDALLRHVVAHEVGHAIDATYMTDASRARWLRARGLPASTSWYACDRCPVWSTGEGDFEKVCSFFTASFDERARSQAPEAGTEILWLWPHDALAVLSHESHRWAAAQTIPPDQRPREK